VGLGLGGRAATLQAKGKIVVGGGGLGAVIGVGVGPD